MEATCILQEYVFEFEYSITGGVSLKMTAAEGRDAASFGSQASFQSASFLAFSLNCIDKKYKAQTRDSYQ